MITYYIGNVREKRMFFRKTRIDAALADNCDVLADFKLNGKVCFVLGEIPYADMRVGEYLGYARALKTRLPLSDSAAKELLEKAGTRVSLCKRMGKLNRLTFRAVLLAAALTDATRESWLNLDGIAYSFFMRLHMRRMLNRIAKNYEHVPVAVSDYRFIPRKACVMAATDGAIVLGRSRSASRRIGKIRFRKEKASANIALDILNGKRTVLCDN